MYRLIENAIDYCPELKNVIMYMKWTTRISQNMLLPAEPQKS